MAGPGENALNLIPLATDADYERYAALFSAIMPPPPTTGAEVKSRDERRVRPGGRFLIERGGAEVGVAGFSQNEFVTDRARFGLNILVRPDRLGEGIATGAQALLLKEMAPFHPATLDTHCREDNAAGVAFLTNEGFVEVMREWESVLDVPVFDPAPFAEARTRPLAAGLRLTTLAEEQTRLGVEPARRLLWELDKLVGPDVPSDAPEETPPFDEWNKVLLGGPGFRPEAFFLAVAPDGSYAGVSMLFHKMAVPDLSTGLTGVRRDYRRHGIALALKLMAIDYAKSQGAPKVRTENATTNRPMLSINEALGFEKEPVLICWKKVL